MNPRSVKRILYAASGVFTLIAAAVVVAAATSDVAVDADEVAVGAVKRQAKNTAAAQADSGAGSENVSLAQLRQLSMRPLRQDIFGEGQQVTAAQQKPRVKLPLRMKLVGIAVEGDKSMAMFALSDGSVALAAVGEIVEDGPSTYVIKAIDKNSVTLDEGAVSYKLDLPEEISGGSGR